MRLSLFLAPMLLLGAYVTPASSENAKLDANSIEGTWYYADVRKAYIPVAPTKFDIMEFRKEGGIKLTATLEKRTFDGTYTLVGNDLTLSFQVPEKPSPVELKVKLDSTYDGRALITIIQGNEMVFYRSSTFLSEDITGNWVTQGEGQKQTMILGKDGSYLLKEANVFGYYRLWESKHGKTMTTVMYIQGEGGYTLFSLYERKTDRLILIPQSENGFQKEKAVTFTLSK